jgi:hypothetical protein
MPVLNPLIVSVEDRELGPQLVELSTDINGRESVDRGIIRGASGSGLVG